MTRRKLELTWDKHRKRWKRFYRGKQYYFPFANSKSDVEGYRKALQAWYAKKLEIDGEDHWDKPNGKQYEHAIQVRQDLIRYFESAGELDRCEEFRAEVAELRKRYEIHRHPPRLELYDLSPLFDFDFVIAPLEGSIWTEAGPEKRKQAAEVGYSLWKDRIKQAKEEENGKTVAEHINRFLDEKKAHAESGQISPGWYEQLDYRLRFLKRYAGTAETAQLNGQILSSFHRHLLSRLETKEVTSSYCQGVMTTVKQFVRWLWENEYLEDLPRNLNSLTISAEVFEIETFSIDEVSQLLGAAGERVKLYILLLLNCGKYQRDVAMLSPNEVDWEKGRIRRKRTKTKREARVPIVDYKLWDITFRLLKKNRSNDRHRVLLTENHTPLVVREMTDSGKVGKIDNIQKAYDSLCKRLKIEKKKPLKLLRKTSASKLEEHEVYGRFSQYFLGHAPCSVAEKRYAKPSPELFDKAIQWLGEQFGMVDS